MVARINLLSLDGIELSDDGREFDQGRLDKISKIELANGNRKQYVKAIKKKFSVSWIWLPSSDVNTSDGKAGRDTLRGLCNDGNTHTLVVRDLVSGVTNTYVVFIDSYTEKISKRDYVSGTYFYEVALELEQQ